MVITSDSLFLELSHVERNDLIKHNQKETIVCTRAQKMISTGNPIVWWLLWCFKGGVFYFLLVCLFLKTGEGREKLSCSINTSEQSSAKCNFPDILHLEITNIEWICLLKPSHLIFFPLISLTFCLVFSPRTVFEFQITLDHRSRREIRNFLEAVW